MSLEAIYVVRHGFRSNWVVDHKTGTYSSSIPTPTRIPSDPALAGKGVDQSNELAAYLQTLSPPIERIYSSPFYRCIQTIAPTFSALRETRPEVNVRLENGVGEWYGMARFDHPSPAEPALLATLFPSGLVDVDYKPYIKPSVNGETINELHDRCAYALHRLIEQSDKEGVKAIVICTHAASLIAIGRALTGRMPEDIEEEDFRPFTCGFSRFERKGRGVDAGVKEWEGPEKEIPQVRWRGGKGVGAGWRVTVNGDCSFLSGGEERGWRFSGDESFDSAGNVVELDAGYGLGVVIEGKRTSPSRL